MNIQFLFIARRSPRERNEQAFFRVAKIKERKTAPPTIKKIRTLPSLKFIG